MLLFSYAPRISIDMGATRALSRLVERPLPSCKHSIREPLAGSPSQRVTYPGHAPWTVRLFGRGHHRVIDSQIPDGDGVASRNVAVIVVAMRRVSIGPFPEAVSTACCQRNVHWSILSVRSPGLLISKECAKRDVAHEAHSDQDGDNDWWNDPGPHGAYTPFRMASATQDEPLV